MVNRVEDTGFTELHVAVADFNDEGLYECRREKKGEGRAAIRQFRVTVVDIPKCFIVPLDTKTKKPSGGIDGFFENTAKDEFEIEAERKRKEKEEEEDEERRRKASEVNNNNNAVAAVNKNNIDPTTLKHPVETREGDKIHLVKGQKIKFLCKVDAAKSELVGVAWFREGQEKALVGIDKKVG